MKKYKSNTFFKIVELIFFSIVAKIFAFVRTLTLAFYYGATRITDVFNISQNIPSSLFTLVGTALMSGFIPTYMDIEKKEGKESADRFFNNLLNILLIISVFVTFMGIIGSRILTYAFGSGFNETTFNICNIFVKIVMPSLIAMVTAHVCNAYLQIHNCFKQNSIMNIPFNIIQIIFIILGFYLKNYYLIAIGLLIASYSQLLYIIILIRIKTEFKFKMILNISDKKIKRIFILIFPIFISTGANQINAMIDKSLASGLIEGSVSALNYASEIITIVTQIIILNITTIVFPKMTKLSIDNNIQKNKNDYYSKLFSMIGIIIFPLTIIIFFYSNEIIDILFGRGAFNKDTVMFVGNALKAYSIGIIGFSYRDVLNKLFYSSKNTKIPMIIGLISVIMNIVLNYILIAKYKYLGLAFATSISGIICTILLFIVFCNKNNFVKNNKFFIDYSKIVFSAIIMILIVYLCNSYLQINNIYIKLIIHSSISIILYLVILIIVREKYLLFYIKSAKNRIVTKLEKRK